LCGCGLKLRMGVCPLCSDPLMGEIEKCVEARSLVSSKLKELIQPILVRKWAEQMEKGNVPKGQKAPFMD